jgi:hypothetical protein
VAHGNEHDSTSYADQSSPMVATQSLMTCLSIAAFNRDCVVGKLDVKLRGRSSKQRWLGYPCMYSVGGS